LERKKAENALEESEQRLQAIIDGSDNSFYVKYLDGHFIFINKHFEQLLGMKRDEVIGKTDYDLFTPELADYYKMHDSKILKTGVPEQLEEVSNLVDGWHTFIANKSPLYDSHGKLYAICGISTDITERKQIEKALQESEERLSLLSDNLPDSALYQYVHELDDGVRFLYCSAGIEKFNSISVQDLLHDSGTLHRQLPPECFE
jgi:PAS domain S-box-containing protein